jgi:hypothetical protein
MRGHIWAYESSFDNKDETVPAACNRTSVCVQTLVSRIPTDSYPYISAVRIILDSFSDLMSSSTDEGSVVLPAHASTSTRAP